MRTCGAEWAAIAGSDGVQGESVRVYQRPLKAIREVPGDCGIWRREFRCGECGG